MLILFLHTTLLQKQLAILIGIQYYFSLLIPILRMSNYLRTHYPYFTVCTCSAYKAYSTRWCIKQHVFLKYKILIDLRLILLPFLIVYSGQLFVVLSEIVLPFFTTNPSAVLTPTTFTPLRLQKNSTLSLPYTNIF